MVIFDDDDDVAGEMVVYDDDDDVAVELVVYDSWIRCIGKWSLTRMVVGLIPAYNPLFHFAKFYQDEYDHHQFIMPRQSFYKHYISWT